MRLLSLLFGRVRSEAGRFSWLQHNYTGGLVRRDRIDIAGCALQERDHQLKQLAFMLARGARGNGLKASPDEL